MAKALAVDASIFDYDGAHDEIVKDRQKVEDKVASTSAQVHSVLQCVAVCCSVLQCVLQCVAECCSVFKCVAMCCSVLQCVAVCC